jgi:chaperonin GroES
VHYTCGTMTNESNKERGGGERGGKQAEGNAKQLETVEPIGKRVLIRKDEDKKQTKSGIHLPDKIEIPTLTGRIVAISSQVEKDADYPLSQYDRVLFNPKHAIPVDFEGDNRLYVVPVEDVVAVLVRGGGRGG